MLELDLEVTAMLSRATERVGLEWRKPPCPEPSRWDDWFLDADKVRFLKVPVSQTGLFGDAAGNMAQQFPAAQEQTEAI